jgi:tRNA(adenine34) deaminase
VGSNPTSSAMTVSHEQAMQVALEQARLAAVQGDVPVGAVVVHNGIIIAARHNEREATNDPTAHAEVLALRDAAQHLGRWRLDDCDLVVTLEPCVMCAGALINARVQTLVFGAADLKAGATGSLYNVCTDPRINHNPAVRNGIMELNSQLLLREFFVQQRR